MDGARISTAENYFNLNFSVGSSSSEVLNGSSSDMETYTVVMMRHGSSELNDQNVFASWFDTKLSQDGKKDARRAGRGLKEAGLQFDVGFTSVLSRARDSLAAVLEELGQPRLPVLASWRLNERHYGALIGRNRDDAAAEFGEEQVQVWRRSYAATPPPMTPDHPFHDAVVCNPIYAAGPAPGEFPSAESLEATVARTLPYWEDAVLPRIRAGQRVLVCAHGGSLRGLAKHLEGLSEEDVVGLDFPAAAPFVYELDAGGRAVAPRRFLADQEKVLAARAAISDMIQAAVPE